MAIISPQLKSYVAGFLDGDGCILFQLVRRKDYRFGFQIRASIIFYQKTKHRHHLEWLQSIFKSGYVRNRNDDMTEYTVVGFEPVTRILKLLKPYIRLKKKHVSHALQITRLVGKELTTEKFVAATRLVDDFRELNYSKKRMNMSSQVEAYLKAHKLYPCND